MSGAELMVEVRRLRPNLKLLLTSGYSVTKMPAADTAEKVPLLRKPYNLAELYRVNPGSPEPVMLSNPEVRLACTPASGVYDIRPRSQPLAALSK